MNRSKFYIHIGTWKTGSSTIQYNLQKNKAELEKEGIVYLSKEDKMVINDGIIRGFRTIDEDYVKQSREKLRLILEEKRKKNGRYRFIASAEEFSGDPFDGFKNAGVVAQTLKEITKNLNLDISIIVYLRRQDDFIESMYTQSIHLGASHSFGEFVEPFDGSSFNWEAILQAYSDCFGEEKLIVRQYHKKFLPGPNSLVQDFGRVIDSPVLAGYTDTTPRNRGVSRDVLEMMRFTNPHFDGEERYQFRRIFQEVHSKQPFEKYSFFTEEGRRIFLSRYSESNANVARKFFRESSGELFPPPDERAGAGSYEGLSREAIAINLSKAILAVNRRMEIKEKRMRKEFRNLFWRKRARDKLAILLSKFPRVRNGLRRAKESFR